VLQNTIPITTQQVWRRNHIIFILLSTRRKSPQHILGKKES